MIWVRAQLRDRDWIQESWDNNRLLSKRKKNAAFGWPLTQCAGKNYNSFIYMLKWKDIRVLRRKSFITSQKWCWRNVDPHPASSVVNSSIRRAAIGWPDDVIVKSAYQLSGPVCIFLNMHFIIIKAKRSEQKNSLHTVWTAFLFPNLLIHFFTNLNASYKFISIYFMTSLQSDLFYSDLERTLSVCHLARTWGSEASAIPWF